MNDNTGTIPSEESKRVERAFLVSVRLPGTGEEEAEDALRELGELVATMGLEVMGAEVARIRKPQSRYFVGEGKASELVELAQDAGADVIIFDDPLTPSQQRNWEKLANLAVIDRQEVILDIFAGRAQTREAVLQVELARANYDLPRLKRRWTHLHRQRGMSGGMGMRGEGEQQLETDSRLVRRRIARLATQLQEVEKHRQVQRGRRLRKPVPVAAIVGYTNAGKSSLLNAMTDADVLVEDKLFATLDPTVRRVQLPNRQELLLADTVGFIRKLPHLLVEAFKSTLEETLVADFLVEVVDVTCTRIDEHRETTKAVLDELGAGKKPRITVMNKVDLITDPLTRRRLERKYDDAVFASATTGEGLDLVAAALARELDAALRCIDLVIPHGRYDVVARLHRSAAVLSERYEEDAVHLSASVPVGMLAGLEAFLAKS